MKSLLFVNVVVSECSILASTLHRIRSVSCGVVGVEGRRVFARVEASMMALC